MKRIEPAARLIHRLTDVIGRELRFKFFLVLERIVPLGDRHGTRVKPYIDQVRDARHFATAIGAIPMHLVHIGSVQIQFAQVTSCFL